eukprot:scaffold2107_cov192-Alexandrium_tamarense.AAC.47
MLNILTILAILVVFYAWFGVVIFYESPQGRSAFPNLCEGIWTLWICVTTANYPDVMMPSYNEHRFVALYWISFMVISFFYLMNLILAVSVNSYDESIAERRVYREELSKRLLTKAFRLLDHDGTNSISRDSIMNVMIILNQDIPEIKKLSNDERSIFFAIMDKDGSSTISLDEFLHFDDILLLDLAKQSDYATFVEINFPDVYKSTWYQHLCNIVRSKSFEYTIDAILLLNAVIIAVQNYSILTGQDTTQDPKYNDGFIDTTWEALETLFTVLYVFEALLKIMVNGWKAYTESGRNLFDFVITIVAVIATLYVYYPNAYSNSVLIRFIVMARVLRLSRILFAIEAFQMIGAISLDIIPAASSVLMILLFLGYLFSLLGMMLLGGAITRDPNNPTSLTLLEAEDFVSSEYWANNFNDMVSGMNVLLNLLIVNNWTIACEGFEIASGKKWMVRLFHFSFHILGVIGIGNVIISFVINAFFQQMKTIKHRNGWEENVEGEAVIKGSQATFDASVVTGTQTGVVKSAYLARIKPRHFDVETDERLALRELFTRSSSS